MTCWDNKEQYYYLQDCSSYSWLRRCKITNYKNRIINLQKEKNLPELPILFDSFKSDILTQIREEEKKEVPADDEEEKKEVEEEKKEDKKTKFVIVKKKDPRNDLFDILTMSNHDELISFVTQEEEQKDRRTEPIANIT